MVETATTFTAGEIRSFLERDNYTVGTPAFRDEMDRRYQQSDTNLYVERDDWDGNCVKCTDT